MDRDRRLSLVVGIFVLVSLAALAVAISSLSSQRGVWTPRYHLVTYFDNVAGLIASADVRLAGTQVGRVESVGFGERAPGEPAVRVVMQIDQSVQSRIRRDSRAFIDTAGLLGDSYVEISVGGPGEPALTDGERLDSVGPLLLSEVVGKGTTALDKITKLATSLNDAIDEFNAARGGQRMAESLSSLGGIIGEVTHGDGLLHSLVYDQYEGSGVESIENSLATLEKILHEIDSGDGVLHSLIYDAPNEQDLVMQFLNAGARLNSILAKVDAGEGSLGLILNDPTLYEDLKLLVDGANRSRVVRTMIDMVSEDAE